MADRDILMFDFETGGRDPHTCQPTQLAAIALDGRNFKLKGTFNSEIRAEVDDQKAIAQGLGPIEEGALKVTGKTREAIAKAPPLENVWNKFVDFVNKYNWKGTAWYAPIPAGYNIIGYDLIIADRLAEQFGPWDAGKKQNKLFNPNKKIDVMHLAWFFTEGDPQVKKNSMDSWRERTGMSTENAHDALQDVKDTANLMIKFMNTIRTVYPKLKIDGCFANGGLSIE